MYARFFALIVIVLKKHIKLHFEDKLECQLCDYKAPYQSLMSAHKRLHEKSKQGYKCQICSYETKFKKEFQHHMSVKHRANDILKCELCRLSFVTEEGLSKHLSSKHALKNSLIE